MTQSAQQLINVAMEDARERIEEVFVDGNDSVLKADVYAYVKALDALDVLVDVLENYQTEMGDDMLNLFNNPLFVDAILKDIEEDEYILPDWYSITDYHDYNTDTVGLIKKRYEIYTEKA